MKLRISPKVSLEALLRDRLLEEGDRAGLERVLAAVARRDDVHRNVPRLRMVLQAVENDPAVHHRQLHVEDDRVGLVLVRERKARVAPNRDDALEAAVARDLELGPREIWIVFDDQHDAVSVLDVVAVVADVARQEECRIELLRLGGRAGDLHSLRCRPRARRPSVRSSACGCSTGRNVAGRKSVKCCPCPPRSPRGSRRRAAVRSRG